jgi:hypothetical protein
MLGALLHASTTTLPQPPAPHLNLCDADGVRASKLRHLVQGPDSDGHLGHPMAVLAQAHPPSRARSRVADRLFVAPDDGLDPASPNLRRTTDRNSTQQPGTGGLHPLSGRDSRSDLREPAAPRFRTQFHRHRDRTLVAQHRGSRFCLWIAGPAADAVLPIHPVHLILIHWRYECAPFPTDGVEHASRFGRRSL